MIRNFRTASLLAIGLCAASAPIASRAQEVGKDVSSTHWAYDAVKDLASKGLIKGYPADGKFLGGRALTRYELATIIERVLARMDEITSKTPKPDVTKADVDKLAASIQEIRDLTDEFKKELLVIGSDLSKAKDEIAMLSTRVGELTAKVDGMDNRVSEAKKRAEDANTLVDQALENVKEQQAATASALAKKMDIATGKVRFSGLIQTWYGTPLGKSWGGQSNPTGSPPPGRNYGGGVGDSFRMRRAELGISGNISPKADFFALFDLGKIPGLSTTTGSFATPSGGSAGAVTSLGANASTDILQDAWVGYQITPRLRIELGDQKTGFSDDGNRSSMALFTIERAIMNGLPTNAGRVGYVRDTGAVLRYKTPQVNINLGIWNDNGPAQNNVDSDRTKFANIVVNYTGTRHLTASVFGGTNVDNVHPKPSRDRAGGTLLWQSGPHTLVAEGAYTLDQSATTGITGRSIGVGGYFLYAHNLSSKWQLVGKYDQWNPSLHGSVAGGVALGASGHHDLKEITLGVNYFLKGNNSKIQLNFINEDTQGNGVSFWGVRRQLIMSNFSAGF